MADADGKPIVKIIYKKVKKARERIERFVDKIFGQKISPLAWALGFLSIIGLRMFVEFFVASEALTFQEIVIEYIHNFFFFILAFGVIWLILSLFLQENPAKLAVTMIWASWLIVLPPLLDIIRTKGLVYWSFYAISDSELIWSQFITFFGHLPSGIVYFGTKITFVSAIILSGLLVLVRSKSVIKAVLSSFCVYVVLFFLGSFPSFFAFTYYFFEGSKKISEVTIPGIMQLIGTPVPLFGTEFKNLPYTLAYHLDFVYYLGLVGLLGLLFFFMDKNKFLAVIRNIRPPQIVYHTGLFFIGLGLGILAYPKNFHVNIFSVLAAMVLIVAIWLAWKASVVVNDIYDFGIDQISNPDRPLQKKIFTVREYAEIGMIFFPLSVLGGLVINSKFAALFFVYQIIAWVYSAPPFRLKKIPIIATFFSAVASLLILFIGFTLVSGDAHIHGLSWRITVLVLAALTLSLPIKDFKDIAGDEKYGILTLPVIFGEEKGKLLVAVGVFASFMLSIFLLNEFRLFWWAVLFGGISYLIVTSRKINPRNLFWWVLASVSAYGLILVKIVFA
ncbi:MAG: hypothetical protein A2Z52_02570 [Candidatus Moranbacteria bacterium RBG_19FT_COMBO_42_6]|nr:MAG: hypothetical protein A2Z52_02570 [Candidatus Moranbacteria bacterium RBG_19FT_COMBO_42_6]